MPAALNLAGQKNESGTLEVIRHVPEKYGPRGKHMVECRCLPCGGLTTILVEHFRSGNTRSCGCLLRTGEGSKPGTAKHLTKAYKENAVQVIDGRRWYVRSAAAKYLGVDQKSLINWRVNCPLLGGEGLEPQKRPGGLGREMHYYAKDDLDRVKAARAKLKQVPDVPGHVYFRDALTEIGCDRDYLRRQMRAKGVKVKKVSAKGKDGLSRRRSYVPRRFVEECLGKRYSDPKPTDKVAVAEAAEILGTTRMGVDWRIRKGLLKAYRGKAAGGRGNYPRMSKLLSRAEVERLANGTAAPEPTPTSPPPAAPQVSEYPGYQKNLPLPWLEYDTDTERVLKFCYDEYVLKNRSRSRVYVDYVKLFSDGQPTQENVISIYSKRWAKRHSPSLPLKGNSQLDALRRAKHITPKV